MRSSRPLPCSLASPVLTCSHSMPHQFPLLHAASLYSLPSLSPHAVNSMPAIFPCCLCAAGERVRSAKADIMNKSAAAIVVLMDGTGMQGAVRRCCAPELELCAAQPYCCQGPGHCRRTGIHRPGCAVHQEGLPPGVAPASGHSKCMLTEPDCASYSAQAAASMQRPCTASAAGVTTCTNPWHACAEPACPTGSPA